MPPGKGKGKGLGPGHLSPSPGETMVETSELAKILPCSPLLQASTASSQTCFGRR